MVLGVALTRRNLTYLLVRLGIVLLLLEYPLIPLVALYFLGDRSHSRLGLSE